MIFKNIAEYEDTDSELAKFTISQLHCKIQELESQNKELARLNIEKVDIILKAIEYIENNITDDYEYHGLLYKNEEKDKLLEILKGEDNEFI